MIASRRLPRFLRAVPVVVLFTASTALAQSATKPVPAQDPLARMNESVDALTRKVWPSVVQILVTSYGAREEIVHAARTLALAAQRGELAPQDITERHLTQALWTADIPDPDFLIRTSGEFRLSNFLLWQLAYTELYVTDTFWPDFTRAEFLRALASYQSRNRRFGRTTEQQTVAEPRRAAR